MQHARVGRADMQSMGSSSGKERESLDLRSPAARAHNDPREETRA
jgi:hypothetical protein